MIWKMNISEKEAKTPDIDQRAKQQMDKWMCEW